MRSGFHRLAHSTVFSLVMISLLGAGIIALALLSQTVPSITIPSNGPKITLGCATVANETNPTPVTGATVFACGPVPGTTAFTVNYATQATPTFALPTATGETLFLHYVSTVSQCTTTLNIANMTSGQAVSFTGPAGYFYCETYYNANQNGIVQNSFTVSWA